MKILAFGLLLAGLFGTAAGGADDLVDDLQEFALLIETLCDSGAASLPEVDDFCSFSLGPSTFQLTPVSIGDGKCMQAEGMSSDSSLTLQDCSSNALQKFSYDGEFFTTDSGKCLQAGRSLDPPRDGGFIRVEECDGDEPRQLFDWSSIAGSEIKLAAYPNFCVVSRGVNGASGDPIITKLCSNLEEARRDGWEAV